MNSPHECVVCGSTNVEVERFDQPIQVGRRAAVVAGLERNVCRTCGAHTEDDIQERENSARLAAERDRLGDWITPRMLKELRLSLNLTQEEAGEFFGGGAKAFAKYESAAITPNESTRLLFRLVLDDLSLADRIAKLRGVPAPVKSVQQSYMPASWLLVPNTADHFLGEAVAGAWSSHQKLVEAMAERVVQMPPVSAALLQKAAAAVNVAHSRIFKRRTRTQAFQASVQKPMPAMPYSDVNEEAVA